MPVLKGTNHPRKTVTLVERMERLEQKRMAKEQRAQELPAKLEVRKTSLLSYDYGQIPEEHRELVQRAAVDIKRRLKRTAEDVVAIGKQLIEIEPLLSGKFAKWFKTEFNMDERSARNFIYAAEEYGDKPEIISGLDVTTLYLLAAPSTPKEARQAIEAQIVAGDIPKPADAKRVVDEHKREPIGRRAPKPKQLPRPVVEAIEAEYTVTPDEEEAQAVAEVEAERIEEERLRIAINRARDEQLTFAEWWVMMPKDEMSLANWLLIFQTAKIGAANAGTLEPRLRLAVTNVMLPWSKFVNAVEKALKVQP